MSSVPEKILLLCKINLVGSIFGLNSKCGLGHVFQKPWRQVKAVIFSSR